MKTNMEDVIPYRRSPGIKQEATMSMPHYQGFIVGSEEAKCAPSAACLSDADVREIGRLKRRIMLRVGYGYLDPESEFLEGFVAGFKTVQSEEAKKQREEKR